MNAKQLISAIKAGELDARFTDIYGDDAQRQKGRYADSIEKFAELYGNERDVYLFSVPGRSEVSGNHTDHNYGRVLAAAINLDIIAIVSLNTDGTIRVKSEGYREDVVVISETDKPKEENFFKSRGIVAGMCRGFADRGYSVGGFDAYTTSEVFKGSGLSSSAAFEVMIGNILNYLYNDGKVENAEIAKIAQFSENVYFGKPCGLMDQTACAVGGFVNIDFADPKNPIINPIAFDLTAKGYSLCIVNTGGNHAELNDDYASVPAEMKGVAKELGHEVLRDVKEADLIENMAALREKCGDRAIMRAMHFVAENKRVDEQAKALREDDMDAFFKGVIASGNSSFKYLQNVYTTKNVAEQGLSLALCVTESFMKDKGGAFRVHGGGFAGTIQAFVPNNAVEDYRTLINKVFGDSACYVLKVRPYGAIMV